MAVLVGFRLNNQNIPLATRIIRLELGVVEKLKTKPMPAKEHIARGIR